MPSPQSRPVPETVSTPILSVPIPKAHEDAAFPSHIASAHHDYELYPQRPSSMASEDIVSVALSLLIPEGKNSIPLF